jgi:hypothetical protein
LIFSDGSGVAVNFAGAAKAAAVGVAAALLNVEIRADLTAAAGRLRGVDTGDMSVRRGGPFKSVLPALDKLVAEPPPRFGRRRFELGCPTGSDWTREHSSSAMIWNRSVSVVICKENRLGIKRL